jgi:hypothetical protein
MKTLNEELYGSLGETAQLSPEQITPTPAAVKPVDRRSPESVMRELKNLRGNALASELDRKEAERSLNSLTGAHAQCRSLIGKLKKTSGSNPRVTTALADTERKLAEIDRNLNDPRMGAKATLDTKTKIADSRTKQVAEFLAARPFDGAPTNQELLDEDAKINKLLAEVEALDISLPTPPNVGASPVKAIE